MRSLLMRAHLVKLSITIITDWVDFTEVWLSSVGVEPGQLQAEDQPHWSRWLPEHSDCLSWWLPVCIRWKGMKSIVLSEQQEFFGLQVSSVMNLKHLYQIDEKSEAVSERYLHFLKLQFIVSCRGGYKGIKPCNRVWEIFVLEGCFISCNWHNGQFLLEL